MYSEIRALDEWDKALKREAAEQFDCDLDDLVRCEKCPSKMGIDDPCEECLETGWVPCDWS